MTGARHYYRIDDNVKKRIIRRRAEGLTFAALARMFGLDAHTIRAIIKKEYENDDSKDSSDLRSTGSGKDVGRNPA